MHACTCVWEGYGVLYEGDEAGMGGCINLDWTLY